jgi:general secretion pathway protein G
MLKNRKGFTLIELMIAITIIAILATVGLVTYGRIQKNARISKRAQDLRALQAALETFKTGNGKYPYTGNGGNSGGCLKNTLMPLIPSYMAILPDDPINNSSDAYCYRYSTDSLGTQYRLETKNLPTSEMSSTEYLAQPQLVDPKKDNYTGTYPGGTNAGDQCKNDPGVSGSVIGWAVYNLNSTNCDLVSE